jgi:hypothetical protein
MKLRTRTLTLIGLAALAAPAILISVSRASDHADTPEIAANPMIDITDVHIFPSPTNSDNVVLSMCVNPLIGPGQGGNKSFDPNALYQFKIDNTGDGVEDLVIQAQFHGTGAGQTVNVTMPERPSTLGAMNMREPVLPTSGAINTIFNPGQGMTVFAGAREDPFFFDLEQFFNILPDRATPLNGMPVPLADANTPKQGSWRPAGTAVDFLSNGGYNVLSIVIELPRKSLLKGNVRGAGRSRSNIIGVWCVTNVPASSDMFMQKDRLSRPVVNEVFATVAGDRHKVNDEAQPSEDKNELKNDILGFMNYPAGRSAAIANVVAAVIVPDVMKVDLGQTGPAAYLGVETGGATGGKFGGRGLTDDVVDISLGIVFGNTIPALGLAPDDGKEIPALTSDHVGPDGKHFLSTFPYLGNPR